MRHTTLILTLVLSLGVMTSAAQTPPQAPVAPPVAQVPPLPTELALRADAHLLRVENLRLKVQQAETALNAERQAIEAAVATAIPGYQIDWNTGRVTKVEVK